MNIEQIDAMSREERVAWLRKIMRVVTAAVIYDHTRSTPQLTNDALRATSAELHNAVKALESESTPPEKK